MYTLDELMARLAEAFAGLEGETVAEIAGNVLGVKLVYNGDGTWSEEQEPPDPLLAACKDQHARSFYKDGNLYTMP